MNKKLIIGGGVVAAVLAFLLFGRGAGGNVSLAAQTDKESYAPGEAIVLTLNLTNAGETTTCVSDAAAGSVRFKSLTRDGEKVATRIGDAHYITSLTDIITSKLRPVAPGESVSIALTSSEDPGLGANALYTTKVRDTSGELTFYDVATPGTYELEVSYRYPGDSLPECERVFTGSTNSATVSFTVTQ